MKNAYAIAGAIAASFIAFAAPAQSKPSGCPVAGDYWLVGRQPYATNVYRGKARISAKGGGCHMKWYPPNDSQGTGSYANGVLTISFRFSSGGSGVVRYTRMASGDFEGVWWMNGTPQNKGIEYLSAKGPPIEPLAPVTMVPPRAADPPPPPPQSGASLAGWTYFESDSKGTLYYRLLGPSPDNPAYRRIELRDEFKTPMTGSSSLAIYSVLSPIDLDCSGRKYRFRSYLAYTGPNFTGQPYSVPEGDWLSVEPGTRHERWFVRGCGY